LFGALIDSSKVRDVCIILSQVFVAISLVLFSAWIDENFCAANIFATISW